MVSVAAIALIPNSSAAKKSLFAIEFDLTKILSPLLSLRHLASLISPPLTQDSSLIVTDSPIRLGYTYAVAQGKPKLGEAILEEADTYNDSSIDIFLKRVTPYNPNGRNQTEDEAKQIDVDMRKSLEEQGVKLLVFDGSIDGYNRIVEYVLNILGV